MLKRTMLRVLPTTFQPVLQQIRLQGLFLWVVKHVTFQLNSLSSNVAKQVARFLLLVLLYVGSHESVLTCVLKKDFNNKQSTCIFSVQ